MDLSFNVTQRTQTISTEMNVIKLDAPTVSAVIRDYYSKKRLPVESLDVVVTLSKDGVAFKVSQDFIRNILTSYVSRKKKLPADVLFSFEDGCYIFAWPKSAAKTSIKSQNESENDGGEGGDGEGENEGSESYAGSGSAG